MLNIIFTNLFRYRFLFLKKSIYSGFLTGFTHENTNLTVFFKVILDTILKKIDD